MLPSLKPYGPIIQPGGNTKIKGASILQGLGQWPYWSQFWTEWDWVVIQRTIDNLAVLRVNCLQLVATGLDDGGVTHPNDATMRAHISQIAAYAASKGMCLNPQLGYQPAHTFANGAAVATAAAVRMAKIFVEQPNIAFIDAMNEINYSPAQGWSGPNGQFLSDMTTFCNGIRAVIKNIPLTVSVGISNRSTYTSDWMSVSAPLTDFHNVHTYYHGEVYAPSVADIAAMRAAPWYKGRFIVGETGMNYPTFTRQRQTDWLAGNGALASEPDCLGSLLWGATQTTGGWVQPGFGMMSADATVVEPALSVPVANWPGML